MSVVRAVADGLAVLPVRIVPGVGSNGLAPSTPLNAMIEAAHELLLEPSANEYELASILHEAPEILR